uniref:Uncharacterized protein n=1 Tax=Brassica oleracea TaxID=3712 RepID=A0A3P6AN38_BRAOL|nr:unnamed protein product [Brassica oleracea]
MTTTQSAMRMVEGDHHMKNWQQASRFGSHDMVVEDLAFLMKRNRLDSGSAGGDHIPSRSGSAPPSMEGSFTALRNLLKQQEGSSSSEVLSKAIESYDSEEEIRRDPAYVAYYLSNVTLNPRLPPPLISRENQHLLSTTASWDGMGIRSSLHSSRRSLSTHREEPEDEGSLVEQQPYASLANLIQILSFTSLTLSCVFKRPHSAEDIHAISSSSLSMDAIASEDTLASQNSTNAQSERTNNNLSLLVLLHPP